MSKIIHSNESTANEDFEAFLKESVSSTEFSVDLSTNQTDFSYKTELDKVEDSLKTFEKKKSFMKTSKTLSASDSKQSFVKGTSGNLQDDLNRVSKDSLDEDTTTAVGSINKSLMHPGKDTLDEMADKDRFFKEIRETAETTVDYGRLVREMDKSDSGMMNATDQVEFHANEAVGSALNGDMLSQVQTRAGVSEVLILRFLEDLKRVLVALMDSLDSTFDKDTGKPVDSRPREVVAEGDERDSSSDEAEDDDQGIKKADGYSSGSRALLKNYARNDALSTIEDDGSEEKIMDTTMKGAIGKTASGYDTSHDMEAIRHELRKLGSFSSTNDFTFPESTGVVVNAGSTISHQGTTISQHGTTVADIGSRSKLRSNDSQAFLSKTSGNMTSAEDTLSQKKRPGGRIIAGSGSLHQLQPSVHFIDETEELSHSDDEKLPPDKIKGLDHAVLTYVGPGQPPVPVSKKSRAFQAEQSGSPSRNSKMPLGQRSAKDKYANIKSSGYSRRSPPAKVTASASAYSPSMKPHQGGSAASRPVSADRRPSAIDSKRLHLSSGDSLAGFLSGNASEEDQIELAKMLTSKDRPLMASSPLKEDVKVIYEQLLEERKTSASLREAMSAMEKDHIAAMECLRADHRNETRKLKQDNYVLSAKLAANNESEQRLKLLATIKQTEGADGQQLALLEKDIREQDKLIAGYQTENERLLDDMKRIRAVTKLTEEKMFSENQKLKMELANVREELQNLKHYQSTLHNNAPQSAVLGAGRIKHLESELRQAQALRETSKQEVELVSQSKQELQKTIGDLKDTVSQLEVEHAHELTVVEERYKKEAEGLHKKLKWYVENQQLLDKDVLLLKQKDEEIVLLKSKLADVSTDVGRKQLQMKSGQNERTAQAKRIQDLERQVKEMENIIKKRHHNSLPALMWAASNFGDHASDNKSPSSQYLEDRIKKLEKQLEQKDEEAKKSLRAVEQKFNSVKLNYEERIQSMEAVNQQLQRDVDESRATSHPHSNQTAMQRELDSIRERNKKRVAELEQTINTLRQDLLTLRSRKELVVGRGDPRTSLSVKDGESETIQPSHDRLVSDKQHLTDVNYREPKVQVSPTTFGAKSRTRLKKVTLSEPRSKKDGPLSEAGTDVQNQHVSDLLTEQHVSELLSENDSLRSKVDALELEMEESKIRLQRVVAEGEVKERCLNEEFNERISALALAHQQNLKNILASHAAEHSTSKVAELASKVSTQEVIIKHLKHQLSESRVDAERLAALSISNVALETQVKQLTDELCEAKSCQAPEMRHFEALQDKIVKIETRHRLRERWLKQLIEHQHIAAAHETAEETTQWRAILDAKNREIDQFRGELDCMLEALRHLQNQRVVGPYSDQVPGVTSMTDDVSTDLGLT